MRSACTGRLAYPTPPARLRQEIEEHKAILICVLKLFPDPLAFVVGFPEPGERPLEERNGAELRELLARSSTNVAKIAEVLPQLADRIGDVSESVDRLFRGNERHALRSQGTSRARPMVRRSDHERVPNSDDEASREYQPLCSSEVRMLVVNAFHDEGNTHVGVLPCRGTAICRRAESTSGITPKGKNKPSAPAEPKPS